MNKTVLALAIFAFCLFPNVLSSNMRGSNDRELGSINLGNIVSQIAQAIENTKNSATNTTKTTTPTTPAKNTTSATGTNTTAPVNNSTSTGSSTAPAQNTTSSSTPATNTSSSTPSNTGSNSAPASSNTTQPSTPSTPSTPATNTTTPTTPTTPAAPTWYAKNDVDMSTFASKSLAMHNVLRSFVGVAPLTWSDSLAQSAQAWAENMAVNGFRHSGRTGENIASTTASTKVVDYLFDLWTKEQDYFIKGCKYPDCSSNGDEVGHYTQMVWSTTTQVGCGFAPGADKQWNYLCCQYYKAGNIIGYYVYPYTAPAN